MSGIMRSACETTPRAWRKAERSRSERPSKALRRAACVLMLLAGIALARPSAAQEEDSGQSSPSQNPAAARAQEVTVSATRLETPVREAASSVTVITSEEIEERQAATVADALRMVPGLSIVHTAGRTGVSSIFLRGAKSEQTLVLLDGVVMNDPISPGRAFDFSALDTSNVERIEVIRGPQSTLYGSDAIGGVVHIITKRGAGAPRVTVTAEGGSFETRSLGAGVNGGAGALSYSVFASRAASEGFSAADEDNGAKEADGYTNTTASARLGWDFGESLALDLILRAIDNEHELDWDYGFGVEDDTNATGESRQRFYRLQGRLHLLDGRWRQTLGYSRSTVHRETDNPPDLAHPGDSTRATFDGQIDRIDWQNDLALHETNTLVLGVETLEETGSSDTHVESAFGPFDSTFAEQRATINSVYAQDQVRLADAFFGTLGFRVDDHDRFGQEQTYRLTAAYLVGAGTKLKATYGTGFKAPTLYQLFSEFGNTALEPERSIGWDVGLEQTLAGGALWGGITYFENRFENLIDFDNETFQFKNISKAETRGIEVEASLRPEGTWSLDLAYTRTESEDLTTGEALLRRPEQQASVETGFRPADALRLGLGLHYVGEREDLDFSTFPAERKTLAPYALLTLRSDYRLTEGVDLFARVENATDEDYEEIVGYGVPGRAGYAGVRAAF